MKLNFYVKIPKSAFRRLQLRPNHINSRELDNIHPVPTNYRKCTQTRSVPVSGKDCGRILHSPAPTVFPRYEFTWPSSYFEQLISWCRIQSMCGVLSESQFLFNLSVIMFLVILRGLQNRVIQWFSFNIASDILLHQLKQTVNSNIPWSTLGLSLRLQCYEKLQWW